ncbi:protein MEI2-like 4 isoform X2 [Andrographis paniculata]|uniref:protein MEI2-like 4 isoform X2 n=1 Tax=Andrographis paniculata TaxID=175694 RepID=UPI0021E8B7FF|nr:protein MEI2-like 4 isoform X2 [Andrographis paniculata]
MMNSGGFSTSSFFSEDVCYSNEVGARRMDHMNGYLGLKSDGTSPLETRVPPDSSMTNTFTLPNNYVIPNQNINMSLGKRIVGAERSVSRSLPNADHDVGARNSSNRDSAPYLFEGDKVNFLGAQHENGLFSSSLSDLISRNQRLSSSNAAYAHSVAANGTVDSRYVEEEEALESLEELEAKTIGNLLPDDDDLLSSVTDGLNKIILQNNGEDAEDLDLFSSVGGLELGEDAFPQRTNQLTSSNGERPSRMLFVGNVSHDVDDSELQRLFEQYGDIQTMYTAGEQRGFVVILYYDVRSACNAMNALQNKLLMGRKLDVHFSVPKENRPEKGVNQSTVLVFNLNSKVSNGELREIFSAYGEVKEIRDAPQLPHHKFIEFYDVRAAEAALRAMNATNIAGKNIKVEPLRPGLHLQQRSSSTRFSGSLSLGETPLGSDNRTMLSSVTTNGTHINPILDIVVRPAALSSASNSLPSQARVEPVSRPGITKPTHIPNLLKYELPGIPNLHPHSLPEYHDGLANGLPYGSANNIASNISPRLSQMIDTQQFRRVNSNGLAIEMTDAFCSPGNGSGPPRRHYMWSNSPQPQQPQAVMWPNSPSFVNGIGAIPRAPSHMLNGIVPLNDHQVGSAPSVNQSIWDRRHATYAADSPDASAVFHPGSLGNMNLRLSSNLPPHPIEFVPHNMYPCTGGSYSDMPVPSKNIAMHPHNPRPVIFPTTAAAAAAAAAARGQMHHPMMGSLDSPNERTRNRRNESSSAQGENKKQFELDVERIVRGEDKRTTLMIKNIPNKYTSKMLLAAIDERHKGTYDFIYLPIDFKNKCNVGYAFINMIDPSLIVSFYETFNGKKWEKFNSEKVASLAYARIQGRAALIAHFQNSSLMNEDKRCRPILFHTDGPNAGDQVPFPMGTHIRPRPGKIRANTSEENHNNIAPQNALTGEDYSNGDSSSSSGKDSD